MLDGALQLLDDVPSKCVMGSSTVWSLALVIHALTWALCSITATCLLARLDTASVFHHHHRSGLPCLLCDALCELRKT